MSSEESAKSWEGLCANPTPSEAAVLAETLENILAGLGELEQEVLRLKLDDILPVKLRF